MESTYRLAAHKRLRSASGSSWDTEASLANAGLSGVIADLYTTDRRMDGVSTSARQREGVKAILAIYEIDCSIESSNKATKQVSQERNLDDDLFDPTPAPSMRLVELSAVHDFQDEAKGDDFIDILHLDIDPDENLSFQIAMEGVAPMLHVDQSVDRQMTGASRKHEISDVMPLLAVDRQVEEWTRDPSLAPKPLTPMEMMLETDRIVNGTNERIYERKVSALIGDLLRIDKSVDVLFMPNIFDDIFGTPPTPAGFDESQLPPIITVDATDSAEEEKVPCRSDNGDESAYELQVQGVIQELLGIDQSVRGDDSAENEEPDIRSILDLFKVDVEVATAAAKASVPSKGQGTPPISAGTSQKAIPKRSIFSAKELKNAREPKSIIGTTSVVSRKKRIGSISLADTVKTADLPSKREPLDASADRN